MSDTYSFNSSAAADLLRRGYPTGKCDCGGPLEVLPNPLTLNDLGSTTNPPGLLVAAVKCGACARLNLHEGLASGVFRLFRGPDQD